MGPDVEGDMLSGGVKNIPDVMLGQLSPSEKFVLYALEIGALELIPEGRKLKSGRISPYFFNSGLFNTGKPLTKLTEAYIDALVTGNHIAMPDVIFGPSYKGIPLATAISLMLAVKNDIDVGYAFNRKEAKGHGEGGIMVGASLQGKKVVIVDDVITTGTSSEEAVEIIHTNGGLPVGCVIAFDRQECSPDSDLSAVQEFDCKNNVPVVAAATLADLISVLEKIPADSGDDNFGEILNSILEYQNKYGI